MARPIELAVIGGSGFYEMPGLAEASEVTISTPYGAPSDAIVIGDLCGTRVAFLARHGRGHRLLPSELPQRANFWALKSLGVRRVLGVSAVGSLQANIAPGDHVVPDQLIDRTRGQRPTTFFGDGVVAHVALADPFCPSLRSGIVRAARDESLRVHHGGTLVVIEGPAFGTRAESDLYRAWGADIVGMTALPEARLAREAELCYALLTAATDYDSWNVREKPVDAETVFRVLNENVAASRAAVARLVSLLVTLPRCDCERTLDNALVTMPDAIGPPARARLGPILARRLGGSPP